MRGSKKENPVPIWERTTLTLMEAVQYTGIGRDKLREISDREDCDFVLWVGNKRFLKREKLEEYIVKAFSLQRQIRRDIVSESNMKKEVPIWEKSNLTLEEAAKYTGIGVNKLREISDAKDCKFVLWVGNKRLLKRKKLEEFLDQQYSV